MVRKTVQFIISLFSVQYNLHINYVPQAMVTLYFLENKAATTTLSTTTTKAGITTEAATTTAPATTTELEEETTTEGIV